MILIPYVSSDTFKVFPVRLLGFVTFKESFEKYCDSVQSWELLAVNE